MNEFQVYVMYLAIQSHFTRKYDYFKYNGQVNAGKNAFDVRKDKYFFQLLAKNVQPNEMEMYIVSNFLEKDNPWIGDITTNAGKEYYLKHKKIQESLTYHYKETLDKLFSTSSFSDLFVCHDRQLSGIINKYQKNEISVESFSILCDVMNLYNIFDSKIEDDYIWPKIKTKAVKYFPFLKLDRKEFKVITENKLKEYYSG